MCFPYRLGDGFPVGYGESEAKIHDFDGDAFAGSNLYGGCLPGAVSEASPYG